MKTSLLIMYTVAGLVTGFSGIIILFLLMVILGSIITNTPIAIILIDQGVKYTQEEVILFGVIAIPIFIIAAITFWKLFQYVENSNTYKPR